MRVANIIAYILVIVGAVNWALFGFFNFNLVGFVFDGARAAQNNYVNDSILGAGAVLGMGAIITSRSSGNGRITVCLGKDALICERERFGALVGDGALIGCSSILSAGSAVEQGARVNPLVRASGFISAAKPDGKSRASLTAIICDML